MKRDISLFFVLSVARSSCQLCVSVSVTENPSDKSGGHFHLTRRQFLPVFSSFYHSNLFIFAFMLLHESWLRVERKLDRGRNETLSPEGKLGGLREEEAKHYQGWMYASCVCVQPPD